MYKFTELLLEAERQALLSGESTGDMFAALTAAGVHSDVLFDDDEED